MRKVRLGSKEKEVLKILGTGVILASSLAIPNLPIALAPFMKNGRKRDLYKPLKQLEEKDLISLGKTKVKLTKKGKELVKRLATEDIEIKKMEKWDGIWRVVSYDIPDKLKKERDYFRTRLLEMGFFRVQESMFGIPYECKEEITVFAHSLGISPYIVLLTTDHIPQENIYRKRFDI